MTQLIDCSCRLGKGPAPREGAPQNTDELIRLMDEFNVTQAVVYHAVSQYSDAALGNRILTEETGGSGRFLPQWAVLPRLWELTPSYEKQLEEMREAGVCSVRLFPAQYGHSLRRYAAGPLLDALAACRLPVFIGMDQLPSPDALYDLCGTYPNNTFVLCSPGYRCLRWLVPVMDSHKNLYAETSNFLVHDGIKEFCKHMGADRLLFGSGAPEASLAAAASQLLLSDISPEDKQAIGAGNLQRLLAEVRL